VARDAYPWLVGSLLVMLASGGALFLSESIKCYYSTPFRVKMVSLLLAVCFTFTAHRRVAMADETRTAPRWRALIALVSLTLWFCVGASGRWIGFSG
jgi:hypothetical protein